MSTGPDRSWTVRLRKRAIGALPPEKLLPDGQPAYVASWIYVFGVLTLMSLVVIIGSGMILSLKGRGRALRQQHSHVVGGTVLLLHGHPPVG
jgi:hypothetical protein